MGHVASTAVCGALLILACGLEYRSVRAGIARHESPVAGSSMGTECTYWLGAALSAALAIIVDGIPLTSTAEAWAIYLGVAGVLLFGVAALIWCISLFIFSPAARRHWRTAREARAAQRKVTEYRRLDKLARDQFKIAEDGLVEWWQVGKILHDEAEAEAARRRASDDDDWHRRNDDDPARGLWDPSSIYYDHSRD